MNKDISNGGGGCGSGGGGTSGGFVLVCMVAAAGSPRWLLFWCNRLKIVLSGWNEWDGSFFITRYQNSRKN